jgi:hypothetical protein
MMRQFYERVCTLPHTEMRTRLTPANLPRMYPLPCTNRIGPVAEGFTYGSVRTGKHYACIKNPPTR